MAYLVLQGNSFDVIHEVVDEDGVSLKSGVAGTLVAELKDPNMSTSAISVSFAEIGTSGTYHATGGPVSTLGTWKLTITDPVPGTAGGVRTYYIQVSDLATILALTALLLTSLARVKERFKSISAAYDSLFNSLISEASQRIHRELDRVIPQQAYTEYHDGNNTDTLWLKQGPLVTLTSLEEVEYIDSGGGARGESLTAIDAADRVEYQIASRGDTGRVKVRLIGGFFIRGIQNYKAVYTAGFATIPEDIVTAATNEAVAAFVTREVKGLARKLLADGELDFDPEAFRKEQAALLDPWRPAESVVI